jgi:hypothetical protein
MEAGLGDEVGDLAQPEHRHGDAGHGQKHQGTVDNTAAQGGGGDADCHRENEPDDGGAEHQ